MELAEFLELCIRDGDETIQSDVLTEGHGFTLVEHGDWEVDQKYQFKTDILKSPCGTYFALDDSRLGSYDSDYTYNPTRVRIVEPRERRIIVYVTKK